MTQLWPVEIRLIRDKRALQIVFEGGGVAMLPAELLRVESPSAEVQGHGPGERKLVPGKRDVAVASIEPIGNYAIRLVFDDGHSTGIYGWTLLAALADDPEGRLARYHDELAQAGLSPAP